MTCYHRTTHHNTQRYLWHFHPSCCLFRLLKSFSPLLLLLSQSYSSTYLLKQSLRWTLLTRPARALQLYRVANLNLPIRSKLLASIKVPIRGSTTSSKSSNTHRITKLHRASGREHEVSTFIQFLSFIFVELSLQLWSYVRLEAPGMSSLIQSCTRCACMCQLVVCHVLPILWLCWLDNVLSSLLSSPHKSIDYQVFVW